MSNMVQETVNMEKLLLDHLLKGSKLIEKWCPACHFPLLKKGVTPLLFSPASVSVQGNSSFDSGASEQEDSCQWMPTDGIPYCLSCETHVVTNEFELAFAAEQMSSSHKMSKKGSLLHLMQVPSRPSSPDKANQMKASGKPQLSVFISPSMDETLLATTEEAVKFEGTELTKNTVAELNTETKESEPSLQNTEIERVKAMLIFTMQSRADVSVSTAHQSPLSPLSDAGLGPESEIEKSESNDSKEMIPEGETGEVTKRDVKDDNVPAFEETLKFDSNDTIVARQPDDKIREESGNAILDNQDTQHADFLIANNNKSNDEPIESHTAKSVDYNIRRDIATKVLARKMVEGYSIQETACVECGMPLMEKNKTVLCFVCPEFARRAEEQQEDINLTEQLRLKTLAEKNRLAEELKEKKEHERKAREQRLLELDEERLKASAKKMDAERTTAAAEKVQLEKLLATLKQLEEEIDYKEKAVVAHEGITAPDRELISDIVKVPSIAKKAQHQDEEQECIAKEAVQSVWSAEMKELEDEARFLEECDVKLTAERAWLAEKEKLDDEARILKDVTLSSEKKSLEKDSQLVGEVSNAKEEKKLFAQKVLDEIHAAEQEAKLKQKEEKLHQEQQEGEKQFHRENIQKTQPEVTSHYLQKLEELEKKEAEWFRNLDFIAAENAERKRVAAEKAAEQERLVAEEEIRKEKERMTKEQEEFMRQQEEIAAEEQKKREHQATDDTMKRLEKINTDVAWFEEMRAIKEKARKLEEEASVQLKAGSELQKTLAEKDVTAEEDELDKEKRRVEEARRLKQEKILRDKAAIEKARKDRLEAARRRVEENAKAEAALMAKLEEEAAAAKLAIEKAKKATTPSYSRGSPLVSFFCSDTSEENDEKTKINKWETKRTKAHASMSSRLNQGWKKTEDACRGKECGAMPLLTFRNSSPYCIVCGGCGSGKDGEYKETNTPLTPRSRRRKGSTTPNSTDVPKLFDFVKIQPVVDHSAPKTKANQPNVFPLIEAMLAEAKEDVGHITEPDVTSSKPQTLGAFTAVKDDEKTQEIIKSSFPSQKLTNANDTTAEAREAVEELIETVSSNAIHDKPVIRETFMDEKSFVENRIAAEEPMSEIKMRPSKKIGTLMLAGWSLLDASCPKCDVLLVSQTLGASELCVNCDHDSFRKAGFNFESEKQTSAKDPVIPSIENGSSSKAKNEFSSLILEIPVVDETSTMMPSQQEREDGEQGREESSRAPLRDTSAVPLPRRPMRASTPKASNEMLELFDLKTSNNKLPGVKKSMTPRTPVRSRPRLFDDDACFDRQENSASRKQLENIGNFKEGNYHSGEATLKQSSTLDTSLSAIMSQINSAKAKLSTPRTGEAVDRPMSDKIEIAELIEQLAAAALAARKLEELA